MRLHTLELTGFGPFRETQRVDFDAFGDDGVFLISGRTGAGKSSILDGVSFALYGTVPRYENGEKRLRSDHSALTDPTEVRLEFTIGDTRWRVTRAPEYERPAKRGGKLTTETARAELEELVGGEWLGRAAKPRDVGIALGDLLGLNAQQFQQVILLAQNKFSRFLLAPGDERQTLLRTLFGTRRFEQYRDDLEQRRRDAQKRLDAAAEHARTLLVLAERLVDENALAPDEAGPPDDLAGRRERLVAAQRRADYRIEQASTVRAQADAAYLVAADMHSALVARAERGRERAAARERLDELEARSPEMDAQRQRLERARAAEALRATVEAADRAVAAADAAEVATTAAVAEWTAAGGSASVAAVTRVEELTADLARWEDAAAVEARNAHRRARLDELATLRAEQDAALALLDTRLAEIPPARAVLDGGIDVARTGAARRDDLSARCALLTAQLESARRAESLAEAVHAADVAHLEASRAASAAVDAVTTLLQRRLDGFAGELSETLVDGEPCAVCGSLAHPHPATPSDHPVTDDDLAEAERARAAAHAAAESAAATAREQRAALSAAQADAAGRSAGELAVELAAATAAASAADAAYADLARLVAERDDLDAIATDAEAERTALRERHGQTQAEHAVAVTEVARADEVIAAARGDFASVAARIADAQRERTRARALADARADAAECARARDGAIADRDVRLAASDFDGVGDVRAALLTPSATAELDAALAAHAEDLSATKSRLFELELDAAGDDVTPEEVVAASAAVAAADAARSAAVVGQRDAEHIAGRLRELAQNADAAYVDVAEIADDAASVTRLADTVAGRAPNTMKMDLETFVLAAELEEIVAAANLRLADMSSGRYTLHHSDARAARGRASGLGIDVLDAYTGRLRSPQSLSGGETFLASLALALGLGEVVTARAGGIRLDTLFVDEGFGSLDPETLDLAMRTLDELRAGGRTVGVISHVEAMKEQLPAQLIVEATEGGPSVIRQRAVV